MTDEQDRRVPSTERVKVQTLVEICGRDVGGAPAFEAEAIDVSGRGMHVRTAYLPELGAPLVCRLEERGREIVVEGTVAWRKPEARGGEFGIRFTALDSGSVDALKELCGLSEPEPPEPEPASAPASVAQGSRVRLHIDGLGSPMKASVRDGGSRKLEVASNLEFLKVGRHLEIEDLGAGMRRGAHIDSVNVVIDPSSQVPQLVVALRYDDVEEATPEPSVIDNLPVDEREQGPTLKAAMPLFSAGDGSDEDDELGAPAELEPEAEIADEAEALRGRIGSAAVSAGAIAKEGGVKLARASAAAAVGAGKLFKGAADKLIELKRRRAEEKVPKRTTAPPPGGTLSAQGRRLRPQSATVASAAVSTDSGVAKLGAIAKKPRVRKAAALSGLAVLVMTVSVLAFKKPSEPPGAVADAPAVSVAVAASGDAIEVDEQGNPIEKSADDAKRKKLGEGSDDGSGITAEVPLFGPTPMATMEPAPLDAPAEAEEAPEAGGAEKADVADELWPESGSEGGDDGAKKVNPSDVPPWGRGRLETPTVHRLRLDAPGGAIQGAVSATGFTVVIPGRKVMESAKSIERRDSRIARVKTKNLDSGAEISFQFKNGIPAYRVRLRKDYVEFLISADGGSKSSTAAKKRSSASKQTKSSKKKSEKASTTSSGKKSSKKKSSKKKSG